MTTTYYTAEAPNPFPRLTRTNWEQSNAKTLTDAKRDALKRRINQGSHAVVGVVDAQTGDIINIALHDNGRWRYSEEFFKDSTHTRSKLS